MSSKAFICSLSLAHIGKPPIHDIDDLADTNAKYCKRFWDHCVNEVLESANWDFANKQVALSDLGNPPPNWGYRYMIPTDCVKALQIIPAYRTDKPIPFKKCLSEDGNAVHILTDQAQAWLSYTARVINPVVFPTAMQTALSWRLAADLAWPLTKDKKVKQYCLDQYRMALSLASTVEAQESVQDEAQDASWIEARL